MYQPYYAPYQMQQPQFQPKSGLNGRFVNDFNEVVASEVPMDGRYSVFAKADMSEIQARAWNSNGTIDTVTFKPILAQLNDVPTNTQGNGFNALNERLSALENGLNERLDNLERALSQKATPKARKEVSSDE